MDNEYSGLNFLHSVPMLVATVLCVSCGGGSSSSLTASSPGAFAAQQTALMNSYCVSSSPFYYEIGDKSGYITVGSIGGSTYTANTQINIASGTKWLFGAYVAELRGGALTQFDIDATHMVTGYHSLSGLCAVDDTVASCFTGANATYTAADVGKFYYDGGHFQSWGNDPNGDSTLGPLTAATLSTKYQNELGLTSINFKSPGLASGGYMTTNDYTAFLRKILNNQLKITALLGTNPVCTLPGSSCPTALNSPIPLAWHYSVGHWVEDNPVGIAPAGDGAFSSPGAFGFYPWIDSTKTYYGVLARETGGSNTVTDSVSCGLNIRKAFMTGIPQGIPPQ